MNTVYGQVTADFSAIDTVGCASLVVDFTDNSTGNITYRYWDFGNGTFSNANNMNPTCIYTSSGYYDVTLTVSDGIDTSTVTKTTYIEVLAKPSADFYHQTQVTGCAPFTFTVNDTSTFTGAGIASWHWDFDDGSTLATGTSVTHTYAHGGDYSVTLIVTDSMGCTDSKVMTNLVHVEPQPNANFYSTDPLSACGPPLTVNISNTSTGTTALLYQWLVGGVPYTTTNVSHTFTASGGYDVKLVVTNTLGCKDSLELQNYVFIGQTQASFFSADTACPNTPTEMYNTSMGGNTFTWDFGDGTTGTGDTVNHAYAAPGLYTIMMIASAGPNCVDTAYRDIYIEAVQANFTSNPSYGCEAPLNVQFTDLSTTSGTIVSWEWGFGVNTTACPACPADTSTQQNPMNTWITAGIYDDTLTVTTAMGCKSTIIIPNNDTLVITTAQFIPSVSKGCGPLTVDFLNTSSPVWAITDVIWDFGDGSPIDTTFNPTHTFTQIGDFTVQLQVISIGGCTTLYETVIEVGTQQMANFAIDTNLTCGSDSVQFINLSHDTTIIDDYYWEFGDGAVNNQPEPTHLFQDTGMLTVTLVVYHNGCPDTIIYDSIIQVMGPILEFNPVIDCDTPNSVTFVPDALGGTQFWWDYGDSSAIDTTLVGYHLYDTIDANYDVVFTAVDTNTGCSDTAFNDLKVRFLKGVLTAADSTPCLGETLGFSTGLSSNALGDVFWSLNDPTTFDDGFTVHDFDFTNPGPNMVYAVVQDENGCTDTLTQYVHVYQPVVQFSANPTSGCDSLQVTFTNNTQSDTNIISWNWNFGDGSVSNLENPTHVFTAPASTTFDVSLTATDTFGCETELMLSDYISIVKPPAYFEAVGRLACDGDTVGFHSVPAGYSYYWDFGDGTTSTMYQPFHVYSAGVYDVTLIVTDANGCTNTYKRPAYVKVQSYPIANFVADPVSSFCYPSLVTFKDSSVVQDPSYWTWNFGDSPNNVVVSLDSALNLYNFPGIYDVTMIVTTTYGCSDTITKPQLIDVGGPTASITVNPTTACVGEVINFDVTNTNIDADVFIWGYGDGVVDTTYQGNTPTSHVYTAPGFYDIILLYSDSSGNCQKLDTVQVEIDEVIAVGELTDTAGCAPLKFTGISQSTGGNSTQWIIDTSIVSLQTTDSFSVSTSGIQTITLIAFDSRTQCADTLELEYEVYPLPDIQAHKSQTICIGDSAMLNATGGIEYTWSPNTFISDTSVSNPIVYPNQSMDYKVTGIDSNMCVNSDSLTIQVQERPQLLFFPGDTSMFLGEDFDVYTSANIPILYKWTPSESLDCDDCFNPTASPTVPTTYQLTYQDLNGCFVFDTTFFINVIDQFEVFIPNAFTPVNPDGDNDTFKPVTFGVKELVYMRIFNRWGEMVYETSDLDAGWDGTYKGEIAAHNTVFSYTIQVRKYTGETVDYIGMVVLISN